MAKHNEEPFNPIKPAGLEKLKALQEILQSKEKPAGGETPPLISGGDGREKPRAAKGGKIQETDGEKQRKYGPSRAGLWSAAVRKGARAEEGRLEFTTEESEEIIDRAREEMEADLAARAGKAKAEAAAETRAAAGAAEPPAFEKEKAGVKPAAPRKERPKLKETDAGREEEIGEVMTSLENLYGDFYGKWAAKGKLAPELGQDIKQMEAEARKLGIKRGEIDEIRERAMRKTGYFDLLPREKPEEPEKPAEQGPKPEKPAAKKKEGSRTESAAAAEETELEKWQREQASAAAQLAGLEREAPRIAAEERAKEEFAEYQREMEKGLEETAETARREREGAVRHERLEQARAAFIKAEQNWEKYLGLSGVIRGWFGRKAEVKKELDAAKEAYEKARAERVGAEISAFLAEETGLADERIRSAVEKKGRVWEKVSNVWKRLGEQNLEKLGWKPQGRFGRIIARGVNARLAVGVVLMGMAVWAGPGSVVALGAIGARRGMAGVGAAVFSSEWLNRRAETWKTAVKAEKLAAISIEEVQERLGDAMVWLKLQGKLPSESEDFGKIQERYEELLRGEYQQAGNQEEYLRRQASELINGFGRRAERAAWMRDGRRAAAAAAGVGAAIGIAPVLRYLYGAKEAVGAAVPEAPELAPQVGGYAGLEESAASPEYALSPEEMEARMRPAGNEAAGVETISAPLPDAFEFTVQYGEGPIHEARKAVALYIAESGDEKFAKLTKAQRVWAEEKLYRAVKDALPREWKAGTKASFPREAVERVLTEAAGQAPEKAAALGKNLAPFVERVSWPRYEVGVKTYEESGVRVLYKPWEWDEGIRRAAEAAEPGEKSRYVPFDPEREGIQLGKLGPGISAAEAGESVVAGAEEEVRVEELTLREEESKEILEALEAAKDAAAERLGLVISRLDPEEYNAIKNLKVSEALEKTYWGASGETRWPSSREPNHIDLWRKGKLRDGIAYVLEHLSMQEREKAVGLTIRQFVKEYYLR